MHDTNWMLSDLVTLPGVQHALLFTADGLVNSHSSGLTRDQADTYAAAVSGLQSLSRASAEFGAGDPHSAWRQTLVEFAGGYVLITAAGANAYLAVSCAATADLQVVSFRMHEVVARMGREMTSPPRTGVATST